MFNSYVSLPEGIELLKAILGSQCAKNIKAESISGTHNGVEGTTALQHGVPHTPSIQFLQSDEMN
jgi:hypothetical protein